MTGGEEVPLRRALEAAVRFVETMHLAQVVASDIEMIRLPLSGPDFEAPLESSVGSEHEADLPWSRGPDEAAAGRGESEEE
jgi:hypothetical protein